MTQPFITTMPTLFLGHGTPMNAILDNAYSRVWQSLGKTLPRPRAILVVSAHWFVPALAVTAMAQPATLHDFGGFPQALFGMQYPAPGAPWLAERVQQLLAPQAVEANLDWGLDHGSWSLLHHVYPDANIPVVQLSIDSRQAPAWHYAVGQQLAPLRDEGILIIGSGNIVHNLRLFFAQPERRQPYAWAERFEAQVHDAIVARDHERLLDYLAMGQEAQLAAPTPEHLWPLFYVLGASREQDALSFPLTGFDGSALSMLSVQFG